MQVGWHWLLRVHLKPRYIAWTTRMARALWVICRQLLANTASSSSLPTSTLRDHRSLPISFLHVTYNVHFEHLLDLNLNIFGRFSFNIIFLLVISQTTSLSVFHCRPFPQIFPTVDCYSSPYCCYEVLDCFLDFEAHWLSFLCLCDRHQCVSK